MPKEHHGSPPRTAKKRARTAKREIDTHSPDKAREAILAIAKVLACQAAQEDDAAEAHQSTEDEEPDRGGKSNPREFR